MPTYRVTIRYGSAPPQYEMLDLEAADLRAALEATAGRLDGEVARTADLAEIRVQMAADNRQYTPD